MMPTNLRGRISSPVRRFFDDRMLLTAGSFDPFYDNNYHRMFYRGIVAVRVAE